MSNKLKGIRKILKVIFKIKISNHKKEIIERYINEIIAKQNKTSLYIIEASSSNNLINVLNNSGVILSSFYYSEVKDF